MNAILKTRLKNVEHIIVVASGKGGVGKSTVAANTAITLAKQGYRVGLLDADIYGPSIHKLFDIENNTVDVVTKGEEEIMLPIEKYGIKIMSMGMMVDNRQAVIWRGPLAASALSQLFGKTDWGTLDYLIVDFPPGTGDIQISTMQQYEVDGAIVVTTPQVLSVNDARKGAEMFSENKMNVPLIGIVENMSWFTPKEHPDEKYLLFGQGGGQLLANEFKTEMITQIPLIQDTENAQNQPCQLIAETDAAIRKCFETIADTIVDFVNGQPAKSDVRLKIAVPTVNNNVDDHFGHCDHYTVFEIDENQEIKNEIIVPAGEGCGCKSNIATTLQDMGVKLLLAGNMGDGAKNVLTSHHIQVIRGCSGNIRQVVKDFLAGKISDCGFGCAGHGNCSDHHECHQ